VVVGWLLDGGEGQQCAAQPGVAMCGLRLENARGPRMKRRAAAPAVARPHLAGGVAGVRSLRLVVARHVGVALQITRGVEQAKSGKMRAEQRTAFLWSPCTM
jgi:hypothetical protein